MLLYLHIPFCHRVCPYCSFHKHTPGGISIGDFIDALKLEATKRIAQYGAPETIYLGGGTPSMLSTNHLRVLFEHLHGLIDFGSLKEVSLEANPATFDIKKAKLFRSLGVTRVSLGIQSFTPHVLEILGREHTPEHASQAVEILRDAEIPSMNIDLMFSIPGQSLIDWEMTLRHAVSLKPNHISAYNLTYEEDTAFFESLRAGTFSENEDKDAEHYHLAEKILTQAGFDHYETSNYAQMGHHSLHNQGYWRGTDYLGLGPSAVSTIRGERQRNLADTTGYMQRINSIGHAMDHVEMLTQEELRIERIALGLRTSQGISLEYLGSITLERAQALASESLLKIENGRVFLTQLGRPLVDPIAAELI